MKILLAILSIGLLGNFGGLTTKVESYNPMDTSVDSIRVHISQGPGFVIDTTETGNHYELICFDTNSERIDEGYLFTDPVRIAICQQYEDDGSEARWPVRTFMNLGGGLWSQVNHFEEDRTLSIRENPEVFLRVDSVVVVNPKDNAVDLHITRYLQMDGR